MADIVVSLGEGAELELQVVDVGVADNEEVLAFTIEGVIRGLDSDLLERLIGKKVLPTEIHFEVQGG